MKKLILFFSVSFLMAPAFAGDLYRCQGPGLELNMVLDLWYGSEEVPTIKGQYLGQALNLTVDLHFRHPRKVDPEYRFIFYKDLNSETMVKLVNPTIESMGDAFYTGYLLIDGKQVEFACINPNYN